MTASRLWPISAWPSSIDVRKCQRPSFGFSFGQLPGVIDGLLLHRARRLLPRRLDLVAQLIEQRHDAVPAEDADGHLVEHLRDLGDFVDEILTDEQSGIAGARCKLAFR